jgi:hypothetical protein
MSADTWTFPETLPTAPASDGLFVTVAVKLWARTGAWPLWFARVVGDPVPPGYVTLALHYRHALEKELGAALPIRCAPPSAADGGTPRPGVRGSRRHPAGGRAKAMESKR